MIGTNLSHFKITGKLGAGGMGEVFRAEDTTLDREVALKVLPTELASDPERLARFEREAKTLAALDHPNIVTIYTVEEADGVRFLTMQLVEGKQLSELIPRGGMPVERIFELGIPLAEALAAAHEKGVIHRDLKPANIMVTTDDRVKVLDFGLAKLQPDTAVVATTEARTEALTGEGRILGTMPYMSPEQLEGKEIDARSDIFSFGAMLYEMATGERPFQGDTSVSLISSIVKDTP
ncbi:MAG: serine/threonine-protein kinase, partial [Thermoanaerobaculia bacterium]